jgi:hypothetical protein
MIFTYAEELKKLPALLANLHDGITEEHPLRVVIDGIDGASKTKLADELAGAME